MPSPLRWLRDIVEAAAFVLTASRKDKSGKGSGFLYAPDDPKIADFFSIEQVFDRRVFVSFELGSLSEAVKFEADLTKVGLEPWRYEPSSGDPSPRMEQRVELAEMKSMYRETVSRLMATVRRCPAVLVLVSEASLRSPYCELEAWATSIIHSFWPDHRVRNEAGVVVVLLQPGLTVPPTLARYWVRPFEDGIEDALAVVLATEMGRLAEILRIVEIHRATIYRNASTPAN